MVLSALRPDASLPDFLVHRAKSASIRRLSLDLLVGLGALSAALWWKPGTWLVWGSAGLCVATYGAWGIVDRGRATPFTLNNSALHVFVESLAALIAGLGILSVAVLVYSVWAIALGTWIS